MKKHITGLLLLAFAVPSFAETYVCDEQLRGGANLQEANLVQYVRDGSGFRRSGSIFLDPIVYESVRQLPSSNLQALTSN